MDEIYKITMGSLLHDIGKVVQRAQDHPFDKKHGKCGYDWLKELGIFEDNQIINATIIHHGYDEGVFESNLGLIWYEADNLASSERKIEQEDLKKWNLYTSLITPFFKIRNPNNLDQRLESQPYVPLSKLDEGPYFTTEQKPVITKEDYKRLLSSLESDLKMAKQYGLSENVLLMILEKHLSAVPSVTAEIFEKGTEDINKHPDISLFDHLKLTSAISVCLYHYFSDKYREKWGKKELLKEEILNLQEKAFLLIGGDISGIQKFIFTITSKGALKSLKGRSFYLELLVEHIISEILKSLKLSRCNIIFAGGGHFYILAYNTEKAIDAVNKVKKDIDDYLFNEFKGSLQAHISYIPFGKENFKKADEVWRELSENLEDCKKKKWSDRIYEVLKVEGQSKDCETDYCEVCFREDIPLEELQRQDTTLKVCSPCKIQYKLGDSLSRLKTNKPGKVNFIYKCKAKSDEDTIKIGEYSYILKENLDLEIDSEEVMVINNFDVKNYGRSNSFYLPLGLYHHENMQELSDSAKEFGMERIAVLRMDVDNLGKIFSQAVPENERTFSRMASISRNLNYFFKGYINYILAGRCEGSIDLAERNWKEKGRMLSVVYSGGDDLFLIGHWLDIIESAYDICNFFKKFTGNKFLTISGGIAINNENYPVYQFANDADRFEKCAKSSSKNAIAFFDDEKAVSWNSFPKIIERVELFKAFLKKKEKYFTSEGESLPTTFFYRLLALARRFKEDKVLILPKCAYLLARLKKGPEDKILKLKEVVMNSNEDEWDITEKSTQLILMMMRKGGKENG